jgi:hypothetical protein
MAQEEALQIMVIMSEGTDVVWSQKTRSGIGGVIWKVWKVQGTSTCSGLGLEPR